MYALWAALFTLAGTLALPRQRARSEPVGTSIPVGVVPEGWYTSGVRPLGSEPLTLSIGLRRGAVDEIISSLQHTSNPYSPQYGVHLTPEHVQTLLAPSEHTATAIEEWFSQANIDLQSLQWSHSKDTVKLHANVATIERLLDTTYYVFTNVDSGLTAIRAPHYRIPESFREHIDTIQPTNMFPSAHDHLAASAESDLAREERREETESFCGSSTTLACIRALYNIYRKVDEETTPAPGNHFGVVGFSPDSSNIADFQTYMASTLGGFASGTYFYPEPVNGGNNSQVPEKATMKANLATQWTSSLTYPVYSSAYYATGRNSVDSGTHDWEEWMDWALGNRFLPYTILIPYTDPEHLIPEAVAKRVCDGFAALASMGFTVIVPSGDSGVRSTCSAGGTYTPQFPATCPYVTTVGGVTSESADEYVVKFSGAGFSNYFSRPDFQANQIAEYLQHSRYDTSKFNVNGRAYPDVTARATDYQVVMQGREVTLSSTVASASTFASIVILLNDALIEAGKAPLGFLNPLLYGQLSAGFKDILTGSNGGCEAGDGFAAAYGWDVASGLGTPNYGKLIQLLGLHVA